MDSDEPHSARCFFYQIVDFIAKSAGFMRFGDMDEPCRARPTQTLTLKHNLSQHRQHRGDTHARCDQHRCTVFGAVDMKCTGWRYVRIP